MKWQDIGRLRILNQHLITPSVSQPQQLVESMGALQAQDYAAAKWAVGLRTTGMTDIEMDDAFNRGIILRTHVLRPTWHFVSPHDIHWLIDFSASRIDSFNKYYYKKSELDKPVFSKCNNTLEKALRDEKQLTRTEIQHLLVKAKISVNDLRFTLLMMRAELDKVICSGPRQGKQFTYALLSERAPTSRTLTSNEALHELATRYFKTRGPATANDFSWWSGITVAEAQKAIDMIRSNLVNETIKGQSYWMIDHAFAKKTTTAFLLPNFDEFHISYTDRSASANPSSWIKTSKGIDKILGNVIVIDGQAIGTWSRTIKKDKVIIEATYLSPLNSSQEKAIAKAAQRYAAFMGLDCAFRQ